MGAGYLAFIKELKSSYHDIGAFVPSSRALGRAMVRPILEAKKKKRKLSILEVGPGTGPFTRQILKLMRPSDTLLICEINPRFVRELKSELPKFEPYRRHEDRVEIFEGPVQLLPSRFEGRKFDVIVSSLPFSNFSAEMVSEILHLMNDLLIDDGVMTFCEYVGIRKIARLFPKRREQAQRVDEVVKSWCRAAKVRGTIRRELALLNIPPAFTYACGRQKENMRPGDYGNRNGSHGRSRGSLT